MYACDVCYIRGAGLMFRHNFNGICEDVLFFNNELDKIQMIELIFQHMVKVVSSVLTLLAIIVDKSQVETEVNIWILFFLSFHTY